MHLWLFASGSSCHLQAIQSTLGGLSIVAPLSTHMTISSVGIYSCFSTGLCSFGSIRQPLPWGLQCLNCSGPHPVSCPLSLITSSLPVFVLWTELSVIPSHLFLWVELRVLPHAVGRMGMQDSSLHSGSVYAALQLSHLPPRNTLNCDNAPSLLLLSTLSCIQKTLSFDF
jgi:hypothetical protein